jgi:hypothetical protein
MSTLTAKELNEVMHDDIYFALPSSIIKWLNSFKINASQRLIMERMIGFAIQRPTRSKDSLRVRLSTSLISDSTSIKERTVTSALQKLVTEGLISKESCNQFGTLYTVNLASEIKSLVKLRFKKEVAVIPLVTPNPDQSVTESKQSGDNVTMAEEKLNQLKERLNTLQEQISSLQPSLPKNFSPAMMLKGNFQFDESAAEEISKLRSMESKLIIQMNSIKEGSQSPGLVLQSPEITSLPRKDSNSPFRFIRPSDSKTLMTRINNLGLFKSIGERDKYAKEILWAIRFGWYRDFKGTTFHCINHALKLIKDNTWRTPAGYQVNQIEGLVAYHSVAK